MRERLGPCLRRGSAAGLGAVPFFLEGGQTQSQKGEWGMGALGLVR